MLKMEKQKTKLIPTIYPNTLICIAELKTWEYSSTHWTGGMHIKCFTLPNSTVKWEIRSNMGTLLSKHFPVVFNWKQGIVLPKLSLCMNSVDGNGTKCSDDDSQ